MSSFYGQQRRYYRQVPISTFGVAFECAGEDGCGALTWMSGRTAHDSFHVLLNTLSQSAAPARDSRNA